MEARREPESPVAAVDGVDRDDLPPLRLVDGATAAPLRTEYAERLAEADEAFVAAALGVAETLPAVLEALLAGDVALAPRLRDTERETRRRCREIEDACFTLLALETPVSRDLRRLVSLLRMVHDVERCASLARHVAEAPEHLDARFLPEDLQRRLRELAVRGFDVYRAGIDAWRRRDALAIHDVARDDRDVDLLRTSLIVAARTAEGSVDDLATLILVGRSVERLADHGVELARQTTFAETGERLDLDA